MVVTGFFAQCHVHMMDAVWIPSLCNTYSTLWKQNLPEALSLLQIKGCVMLLYPQEVCWFASDNYLLKTK